MPDIFNPNMTVKEAADYLHVSTTVVYSLCNNPSFKPAFRIPGTVKLLINRQDLDAWIAEQQKATSEENKRIRGNHKVSRRSLERMLADGKR